MPALKGSKELTGGDRIPSYMTPKLHPKVTLKKGGVTCKLSYELHVNYETYELHVNCLPPPAST